MSIFVEHVDAAIPDHDHSLRLIFVAFDILDLRDRRGRAHTGQRQLARFHFAERLLE